jgi:hypothetical protein
MSMHLMEYIGESSDSDIFYAASHTITGSWVTQRGSLLVNFDDRGIARSEDEGVTWTRVLSDDFYTGAFNEEIGQSIYFMGAHPSATATLFVYRSDDDGETWTQLKDWTAVTSGVTFTHVIDLIYYGGTLYGLLSNGTHVYAVQYNIVADSIAIYDTENDVGYRTGGGFQTALAGKEYYFFGANSSYHAQYLKFDATAAAGSRLSVVRDLGASYKIPDKGHNLHIGIGTSTQWMSFYDATGFKICFSTDSWATISQWKSRYVSDVVLFPRCGDVSGISSNHLAPAYDGDRNLYYFAGDDDVESIFQTEVRADTYVAFCCDPYFISYDSGTGKAYIYKWRDDVELITGAVHEDGTFDVQLSERVVWYGGLCLLYTKNADFLGFYYMQRSLAPTSRDLAPEIHGISLYEREMGKKVTLDQTDTTRNHFVDLINAVDGLWFTASTDFDVGDTLYVGEGPARDLLQLLCCQNNFVFGVYPTGDCYCDTGGTDSGVSLTSASTYEVEIYDEEATPNYVRVIGGYSGGVRLEGTAGATEDVNEEYTFYEPQLTDQTDLDNMATDILNSITSRVILDMQYYSTTIIPVGNYITVNDTVRGVENDQYIIVKAAYDLVMQYSRFKLVSVLNAAKDLFDLTQDNPPAATESLAVDFNVFNGIGSANYLETQTQLAGWRQLYYNALDYLLSPSEDTYGRIYNKAYATTSDTYHHLCFSAPLVCKRGGLSLYISEISYYVNAQNATAGANPKAYVYEAAINYFKTNDNVTHAGYAVSGTGTGKITIALGGTINMGAYVGLSIDLFHLIRGNIAQNALVYHCPVIRYYYA